MYGQRVWDRSGERQKGYRDTSAQKPRESIKRGNDIEDDIIEQPTSFRNQCIFPCFVGNLIGNLVLEKLERDENRDERLTNGRKSVTNQEEKEATIKGTLMSGNPQVMRLAQKYNQIKNK